MGRAREGATIGLLAATAIAGAVVAMITTATPGPSADGSAASEMVTVSRDAGRSAGVAELSPAINRVLAAEGYATWTSADALADELPQSIVDVLVAHDAVIRVADDTIPNGDGAER